MDNSKKSISDFELILQKRSNKKPSFLYNKNLCPSDPTYKPQYVIKTVCSQVKALQVADSIRFRKSDCKSSIEVNKSNFLPLNKLPVYGSSKQEVPNVNPHKFETQCEFDTQLMDIIDNAANIDANTGITQEFDTSFGHIDKINSETPELAEKEQNCLEINSTGIKNKIMSFMEEDSKNIFKNNPSRITSDIIVSLNKTENQSEIDQNLENSADAEQNSQISITAIEDTVTFINNLSTTQEVNEELERIIGHSKDNDVNRITCLTATDINTGQDIEICPSPILNTKSMKQKLRSPLVVSLESFENFENIAMSLINKTDFETAKHIINSQILGKELCLNDDVEILTTFERDKSPILDFKSDELKINSSELKPAKNVDRVILAQDFMLSEKRSEIIKDDILFSSDEEDLLQDFTLSEKRSEIIKDDILFSSDEEDLPYIKSQDLSPTCVSETSNDQYVPGKSLYVGFQTASNKSIQISGVSYEKAQSFFSKYEGKALEEFSLTELVEKCYSLKPRHEIVTNTPVKAVKHCKTISMHLVPVSNDFKDKLKEEQGHIRNTVALKSHNLRGFMTASNRKINISDKALTRCQNLFKDIDLNENFGEIEVLENTNFAVGIRSYLEKPEQKIDNIVSVEENADININDKVLIEEFENIEMSLGEEKSQKVDQIKKDFKTNNKIKCNNQQPIIEAQFACFKTANNKEIKISDLALEKSKNLFKDIDNEEHYIKTFKEIINQPSTSNMMFDEFKTDNNQNIEVSDKAFYKTNNQQPIIEAQFAGFKTANNKEIKISDLALAKSKNLFKDTDNEEHYIKTYKEIINQPSTSNMMFDEIKTDNNQNIEVSDEAFYKTNNQQPIIEAQFAGFKTANNKEIKISDLALAKSKNLFKDIDNEDRTIKTFKEIIEQPSTSNTMFEEFKTENNQNINVSYEAFSKTNNQQSIIKPQFAGFKTANNKEIKISDVALAKSKNLFKDIDNEEHSIKTFEEFRTENNQNIEVSDEAFSKTNNQQPIIKAQFAGFKTANNKEIKICDSALAKSKNLFKDIDNEDSTIKTFKEIINQPSTSNTMFVEFKTASNKNIKVSDEALSKTKYVFKDIDREQTKTDKVNADKIPASKALKHRADWIEDTKTSQATCSTSKNILCEDICEQYEIKESNPLANSLAFKEFKTNNEYLDDGTKIIIPEETEVPGKKARFDLIGFKTANNTAVNISTEAIEKTKNLFSDLDPTGSKNKTELCTDNNALFMGFQTASKKPVTLCANALAKSKRIFEDIYDPNDTTTEKIPKNTNIAFFGFQTDKEKLIQSDNDTSIASNKLLNGLSGQMDNSRNAYVSFKTASNNNINISDEALEKYKKIFSDIDYLPIVQDPAKLESKEEIFAGFQTANKKKVEISKVALEKTKNLFDDGKTLAIKDSVKSFVGFQTARNETVLVSEQTLAKSRQLFQDIDSSNISVQKKTNNVPSSKDTKENITPNNNLGIKIGTNTEIPISVDDFTKPKKLFTEHIENDRNHTQIDTKISSKAMELSNDIINIDKMLDTQVINDFEEDICTEDFKSTFRSNKRSGSPILLCPKAKKIKKFETPYKNNPKPMTDLHKDLEATKPDNIIRFRTDYKKNKKYALQDLIEFDNSKAPNIDPYILNFNLDNILNFEFDDYRNDFKEGKMVIDEIKDIFTKATDQKLIPDGWFDIHLKLILWKLISYEIRFPSLGKFCTVKNVIDQIKYRYDKELYNTERSVLRKIMEKDDVPNKTMVLCVAAIYADGVSVVRAANINNLELLLTDGWYFIKATIDNMLSQLVHNGKIVVGSKIVTCGAELLNCDQGVAPWEDTSSIRLSISGNSTRPARWSEKLGLRPCTMVARLADVRVGGGRVTRLRVLVVRVYPRLYVEKFEDGSTVTRSERLEDQYQMKYDAERRAMIERIYEEVEKEMSDQESQDSDGALSNNKRRPYDSGSQIAKMMKTSKDPMEFQAHLTSSQVHLLQDHVSKQRDKYLQAVQDRVQERLQNRNVVTLVRGRVAGLERDGDKVTVTKGMLSIWKPNDELLEIFKEGSWMEISNVVPTAFRNSEIQLSAGRQSLFRSVKCKEDIFKPHLISLARTCYKLKDLSQYPSMTTDYNEVDTVGMVFLIDPSNRDFDFNKNQFQNVYLADMDKNIICVNFWGGIKKFGYENIVNIEQVIYCGNLQKRAGNSRKNIPQFRATEFTVFTKTPKHKNGRVMLDELNQKLLGLDKRRFCEDCVAVKQNFSVIRCLSDSNDVSPYRFNNSDYNLCRNKIFIDTPVGVKVNRDMVEDLNLMGLDFDSTFKQQDTQLLPDSLERKKKKSEVSQKIAKLKMYGEPPPLSPIHIMNKSKNAYRSYKSPLTSETSNIPSVTIAKNVEDAATPKKLPDASSPIISNISINRTYVKRINPVKLSFSENVDKSVDHFAEEFDGSPPLSLE